MDEDTTTKVEGLIPAFNDFVRGKLLIVDESVLSKEVVTDFKALNRLYKHFDAYLEGLDFVVYDHVNQLELMFKDLGNTALKTFTSSGKTFMNCQRSVSSNYLVRSNQIVKVLKEQVREMGKYDLLAISDLNEIERSFYLHNIYVH